MKVVVLTGPESAGKSTLCTALAEHFNAPVVREYVREYIDQVGRATNYADIEIIAREQLARERAARERAARALKPPLLLLDTHLLSNMLWSQTLFARSPDWIEQSLLAQHYDAIFLLSPEGMPWQADGQRCQPGLNQRQDFYAQLHRWLTQHQQPVVPISGSWQARLDMLMEHINGLS
ncbi:AAA family ATPase [Thiopseudomonas acetoxidans]|uniref:AAA family ATPase n=1 Tax=Thiopseudomonas acetoxidans TaxID=3041622 RepID=A0ABT7SNR0_9GAMM|nr:AAA family ATPase [Thiopseudomonas sp. CY1220]MDM7857629.1 AAA family ATPase [Thiopseudomonas sp. CY1220]